jgi:hypothetical protein
MSYGSVTVTDTATQIVSQNTKRKRVTLVNTSASVTIYFGPDNSITDSNAIPLYPRQGLNLDKITEDYLGDIYGITSSGTADIRFWERVS